MEKQTLKNKLKFINGIALYIGKGIVTNSHRHFAVELAFSFENTFKISTLEKAYGECKFAIIPKNVEHRFEGNIDDHQVFIFIDPSHQLANEVEKTLSLSGLVVSKFPAVNKMTLPTLPEWIALDADRLSDTVRFILAQIMDIPLVICKTDPRIVQSFQHINNNLHKIISISSIASSVLLSESRYAHLFKLEVGIPFRRYVLWQRMQITIQSILRGNSLTSACYDGGFSDISHFNKVFQEMFGITPSAVLKG